MNKSPIFALLTDFGTEDGYVGAMKGRIQSAHPSAKIIDISHSIQAFDVRQAAFCLSNSYPFFPEKTIFVVVVDPGVGPARNGIVVKTSQHYFVGPDNGVFSYVYRREGHQLTEIQVDSLETHISPAFRGRDVFSYVAAMLAAGADTSQYLSPTKSSVSFLKSPAEINENEFLLEVIHIDHFGNLILNFHKNDLMNLKNVTDESLDIKGVKIRDINITFGEVPEGEHLLVWGTSGFLQIVRNMGSAAKTLAVQTGEQVQLTL